MLPLAGIPGEFSRRCFHVDAPPKVDITIHLLGFLGNSILFGSMLTPQVSETVRQHASCPLSPSYPQPPRTVKGPAV